LCNILYKKKVLAPILKYYYFYDMNLKKKCYLYKNLI